MSSTIHVRRHHFDGWKAPSIMQVPGAREVAVEFFTLSKSYNMAGWRIGHGRQQGSGARAVADQGYHDYGTFTPIRSPRSRLEGPQDCVADIAMTYQKRRVCWSRAARSRMEGRHRRHRCTCGRRFEAYRPLSSPVTKQLLARARYRYRPASVSAVGDGHVQFAMIKMARTDSHPGVKQMFREDGLA
jgi:alanine-synthesizing transaminase